MGSVERADYMDNGKVAEVQQTIQKERAIQRKYFEDQERLGKIKLRAPTPPKRKLSLKEKYGVPPHLQPILDDPESAMALTLSRQLWNSVVPGYSVRDGAKITSVAKTDYVWDEEEIDFMKQQRMLDKTRNRRRDAHTHYVECRAKYEAMMGKPQA